MKVKRILSLILAFVLLVPFCACGKKESPKEPATGTTKGSTTETTTAAVSDPTNDPTTDTTPQMTTREIPDYASSLRQYLGVDPAPSSFNELKEMAQALKEPNMYYDEDEDHHYCTLVHDGYLYYIIRYEKAQEWFEYYFSSNDYLSFENDESTLIIIDESYTGPEGMLMMYNFRAFVDDSCKCLIIVVGYDYVPVITDSDIDTFKSYIQN